MKSEYAGECELAIIWQMNTNSYIDMHKQQQHQHEHDRETKTNKLKHLAAKR